MTDTIVLAGGCFWCTEAIFKRLRGVLEVTPGYAGGWVENPSYEQVCSGKTGHAEAIQIQFDPSVISTAQLLKIFFHLHDPTTRYQQGADRGTQYRSAIFYHNEQQKKTAEEVKKQIQALGVYKKNIVTEIVPLTNFYKAENYHQNYYEKNSYAPYCQVVIDPKIQKLLAEFASEVKPDLANATPRRKK